MHRVHCLRVIFIILIKVTNKSSLKNKIKHLFLPFNVMLNESSYNETSMDFEDNIVNNVINIGHLKVRHKSKVRKSMLDSTVKFDAVTVLCWAISPDIPILIIQL